jgi:hypothetical protein
MIHDITCSVQEAGLNVFSLRSVEATPLIYVKHAIGGRRCSKAHDDDYRTSDAGIGLAYRDTPNAAR